MERGKFTENEIDVPIEEVQDSLLDYLQKLRENGTKTIKFHEFLCENAYNAGIDNNSNRNEKYITRQNESPLHPPYMYLSFFKIHAQGPVNNIVDIPLKGEYLLNIVLVFFAALQHKNTSCVKNLSSQNRRTLNRGIPAPKHLPITSIAYGKIDAQTCSSPLRQCRGPIRGPIRANIAEQTIKVLSYWNTKPGLTRHKLPSNGTSTRHCKKSDDMVRQLLDGKMFCLTKYVDKDRKFSIEEILSAIDKFSIVCTSLEYMPFNKDSIRRLGFTRFIYDELSGMSWFLKCIDGDLKRTVEAVMRPHVKPWYDALKDAYLSSRSSRYSHLSERDTENLLDAAKILYNFQRRVIEDLTYVEDTIRPLTPLVWCGWLFEALDYKTSPSRLADPRSCNYFLYSFLIKRGRLPGTQVGEPESVPTFSIYEQAL